MILYVDKLFRNDLGGVTYDFRKAEYILALHGWTVDYILRNSSPTAKIPSAMFCTGRYIVAINIAWDLSFVNFGFLNYNIDLAKYYNIFDDCMTPKAVAAFHQLQEELKLKEQSYLNQVVLSDNNVEFEKAYRYYKKYRNQL